MKGISFKVISILIFPIVIIVFTGCCLRFNTQTPNTRFNVGDVILTSCVNVSVEEFQWATGNWTSTGHAIVDTRNYAQGSGLDINANNVNLHPLDIYPVKKLSFKFGELGGNNNININGIFQNVSDLISLNGAVIGGVNIIVNATQQGYNWYGDMTLEGTITDFVLGGQELWVDDFCYIKAD